jgi:hypothetical protein
LDLLAPLLTLETQAAVALWPTVVDLLQRYWKGNMTADTFTVHHYLAVLELAGQQAQKQPHPWIPALRPLSAISHLGVTTSPTKSNQPAVNPLPWLVILRSLAPQLIAQGQPRLAYACLFAAAPPNRQMTIFDRHSYGINDKQSIIRYIEAAI